MDIGDIDERERIEEVPKAKSTSSLQDKDDPKKWMLTGADFSDRDNAGRDGEGQRH